MNCETFPPVSRALAECSFPVPLPSTQYRLHFSPSSTLGLSELTVVNHGNEEDRRVLLTQLSPNTVYRARVDMSNVYMEEGLIGDFLEFR